MAVVSQVYEIQTPDEAYEMAEAGIDHIGCVVLPDLDLKTDKYLLEAVEKVKSSGKISSVIPLFSDFDEIMNLIDYLEPDILHMCENLSYKDDYSEKKICEVFYELQHKLKTRNNSLKFMRSIPVISKLSSDEEKDISGFKINFYNSVFGEISDYFLTDTIFSIEDKLQPVPGFVGITGKTCEWELAAHLVEISEIPVILAGGLSPENVYDAILKVKPFGVDSCSNTNILDENGKPVRFKKDLAKVKNFVEEIKRAEKEI